MGIVILRISIFDKNNLLNPYRVSKDKEAYFIKDLSFYSKEHAGTFHFLQFNVLYSENFLNSPEFKHFLKFVKKSYPDLKQSSRIWQECISKLNLRKSVLQINKEINF